jgi:hypothetical protein
MEDQDRCRECGEKRPADAPGGLCSAASDAHTPVLNGHVLEPAMLREAERVLAIATRQTQRT